MVVPIASENVDKASNPDTGAEKDSDTGPRSIESAPTLPQVLHGCLVSGKRFKSKARSHTNLRFALLVNAGRRV